MPVLIEHIGFGGRQRDLFLYFWDQRDGPDWSGWWCTPDFCGNNDFILHCASDRTDPCECPLGDWRSPHFENTQLRRRLQLGFQAEGTGPDRALRVSGTDAAVEIIPDGISRIDFSAMVFREDGLHHGRPCYRAHPKPAVPPPDATKEPASAPVPGTPAPSRWAWLGNPIAGAALCIAQGFAMGAAAASRRRGS